MKQLLLLLAFGFSLMGSAQNKMTPELLWKLGRVAGIGLTKDKQNIVYAVNKPDVLNNTSSNKYYKIPFSGGKAIELDDIVDSLVINDKISPDGKFLLTTDEVLVKKVHSSDLYPSLPKANAYIYESLNYRHWDTWEDGKFGHVFYTPIVNGKLGESKDIMPNEPYDCPLKPSGGGEDFIWNPDSKHILYVTKKKFGTGYAISTNTDLYEYDLISGTTKNLTESNKGYDVSPSYNNKGILAWLSMKHDGYESDKQDIVIYDGKKTINLTKSHDNIQVEGFKWSEDNQSILFWAPINGTIQLFSISNFNFANNPDNKPIIRQITKGNFDVTGIIAQKGDTLIVSRTDFNHAAELFSLTISKGEFTPLTTVNDAVYNKLALCKSEKKFVTTTDNKKMLVWVILPPNFDSSKKYPTLLYCQGGPQVALTQFYSYRWNLQLIASQGYVVVAPCRRGMPGFGTKWNEEVSKDWGGQVIQDYLSAIDAVSKEKYVDINRRGCVGASFGGFSVFALEGEHKGRFKTFISHDGIFDFKSNYGTTDELFFSNWEMGGNYWDKNNLIAQKSFSQSPSNFVDKWNTPILIVQGGKDYRVPIEQGQQAFQAAQLKGIKSKLLYLPEENHWVLSPQNALVWQQEFFKWLDETMPQEKK